jgi:hypothetical protein
MVTVLELILVDRHGDDNSKNFASFLSEKFKIARNKGDFSG